MIKKLFTPPTAMALAEIELNEARRQLLAAETQAEHYQHRVNFLKGVIRRLDAYMAPTVELKGDFTLETLRRA